MKLLLFFYFYFPADLPPPLKYTLKIYTPGGICGVMITVIGNGHGDLSSNSGWGCLYST